jgi:aspartyl-tRNA(Asn)/glutamyl-tRNA(Gln) amidotransferase subunit B
VVGCTTVFLRRSICGAQIAAALSALQTIFLIFFLRPLVRVGRRVAQETMLWDANQGVCRPARSKEDSHDYRYFPEPDLPPLILDHDWIDARAAELPELPGARRRRIREEFGLGARETEQVTADPKIADYFESVARAHGDAKTAANWVMRDVLAVLNETGRSIDEFALQVRPLDLAALLDMVRDGRVSHAAAAKVFTHMVRSGDDPRQVAEREGLLQVSDDGQLREWVDAVVAENPSEAERFVAGEKKLQGVLVGKVMKKSNGSADPKRVNALLTERVRG